jgi:hypothetical protein
MHGLWFIWPLYYLSFFYSLLVVVHLAIVLSVFFLSMASVSFGHYIICLSSVHGLWFIWPLCFLSIFCAWLVEERQIIQWPNEPEAMHRRKTDNTIAK